MTVGDAMVAVIVTATLLLAMHPLSRSGLGGRVSWLASLVTAESPFWPLAWLVATTVGAVAEGDRPGFGLGLAGVLVAASTGAVAVITVRSLRARRVIGAALDAELGTGAAGRQAWEAARTRLDQRRRWWRLLLAPLPLTTPLGLRRTSDLSYGPDGRRHRLDVYRHRSQPLAGPVLVHLHGGGFTGGRKSFEARPLLHHLARHGWLCVSADYRRLPDVPFAAMVDDVDRAVAWTRRYAEGTGADPGLIFLAGSSAGAHLAVTAALGPGSAAGAVAGVIGLYGYYGAAAIGGGVPTAGTERAAVGSARPGRRDQASPPMLIAHGDQDTFVSPANARALVDRLRRRGGGPVIHIELPGAQHSFDLLHSIRFETLITGIEAFAAWVVAGREANRPAGPAGRWR